MKTHRLGLTSGSRDQTNSDSRTVIPIDIYGLRLQRGVVLCVSRIILVKLFFTRHVTVSLPFGVAVSKEARGRAIFTTFRCVGNHLNFRRCGGPAAGELSV